MSMPRATRSGEDDTDVGSGARARYANLLRSLGSRPPLTQVGTEHLVGNTLKHMYKVAF